MYISMHIFRLYISIVIYVLGQVHVVRILLCIDVYRCLCIGARSLDCVSAYKSIQVLYLYTSMYINICIYNLYLHRCIFMYIDIYIYICRYVYSLNILKNMHMYTI